LSAIDVHQQIADKVRSCKGEYCISCRPHVECALFQEADNQLNN